MYVHTDFWKWDLNLQLVYLIATIREIVKNTWFYLIYASFPIKEDVHLW